jgi:acyl-CoA synthetase (NDP forming)
MSVPTGGLDALFQPRAVAVLGVSADPTKQGNTVFRNLAACGFGGRAYAVGRSASEIDGQRVHAGIADLPEPADVAFLALPADVAVASLRDCAQAGVRVAIIGAAGFAESVDAASVARQRRLAEIVAETGIRVVGPNCNGIYNGTTGLAIGFNTAHSRRLAAGDVAILSHSGALFDAMVARLTGYGAGLAAFVSAGNEADLTLLDYLAYWIEAPGCRVVAMLLDAIADGPRFRALAARASELGKSIVVLKIGASEVGAQAALAHSSRLAGSRDAYDALFAAAGVPSVSSIEALMAAAALLSAFGRVAGGMAGISTSGAGAALVADLAARHGIAVPPFGATAQQALLGMRRFSRLGNPVDMGAFGGMVRVGDAPSLIAADPGIGLVMAFVHSLAARPRGIVMGALARGRAASGKPFVIIAPGGLAPDEHAAYQAADLRVIPDSDAGFQAIAAVLSPPGAPPAANEVAALATPLLDLDRPLTEPESLALLAEFGIATVRTELADSEAAALRAAEAIGWPVALKGVVEGVAHKTEAGLVRLDLADAAALRAAYRDLRSPRVVVQRMARGPAEAIIGVTRVDRLGPMLVAGLGGLYAEALRERVLWPLPAGPAEIAGRLADSALGRLLASPRWRHPGTLPALVEMLLRLQDFARAAGERLSAVDINPVLLTAAGPLAVDALIVPAAYSAGRTSAARVSSSARAL